MKIKYIIFISAMLIDIYSFGQTCTPEDIELTSQEQINNFPINYPGCCEIEGDLWIKGNSITNLDSLYILKEIGGNLIIDSNDKLSRLNGLHNLEVIGGTLFVGYNPILQDFKDLQSLHTIHGALVLDKNTELQSLDGLRKINSLDFLFIQFNNSLTNLMGLDGLKTIDDFTYIRFNDNLQNFNGLNTLSTIGGDFQIRSNRELVNLTGLQSLNEIKGALWITLNQSLSNLSGLDNLNTIGYFLALEDNSSLKEINDLGNLKHVKGIGIYYNDSLQSIEGIRNIYTESLDTLMIHKNGSLTTCHVESICNLYNHPETFISIFDNAVGCNSFEEIQLLCEDYGINENKYENKLLLYPNPTSGILRLHDSDVKYITVYNYSGQVVYFNRVTYNTINISHLSKGFYIMKLSKPNNEIYQSIIKL